MSRASASSRSAKQLMRELSELAHAPERLASETGRQVLGAALAAFDAKTTLQAAKLVAEHSLRGFEPQLRTAYTTFAAERAQLDPGCLAKEAVIAALESIECTDAELFAHAALYVQRERGRYGTRDTGAGVRARSVLGLARLGHGDLVPILGACLADRDARVRLSAARAIAHRGQRDTAGLLLLRLGAGDAESEVIGECLRGLFATASDLARRYVQQALHDPQPELREQTLHALGTVHDDAAVALLAEELREHTLSDERRCIIEVLGLSLRSSARELLLELLHGDDASDAEAALTALAIHRHDQRLIEQLRAASAHSERLRSRFEELRLG